MSEFVVDILGCGAATPSTRHLPACQAIEYKGRVMMVDCGESAQLSLRRNSIKFSRINHVFISHLHGDHLLGLPGLLSTLSLHELDGTVHVHIFEQGARMLQHVLDVVSHNPTINIIYDIIDPTGGVILDDRSLRVTAFPLYHTAPCVGFRFDEKPKLRHLRGDMVRFLNIPVSKLAEIKAGADYVAPDGRVFENARLTTDADHSGSYAYCSDTVFNPAVARAVEGVDVLYHEATYGSDLEKCAGARGHSTPAQAAEIARMAGVGKLVLGHFSKRYPDSQVLLDEARAIFPNTVAADEGMKIVIA